MIRGACLRFGQEKHLGGGWCPGWAETGVGRFVPWMYLPDGCARRGRAKKNKAAGGGDRARGERRCDDPSSSLNLVGLPDPLSSPSPYRAGSGRGKRVAVEYQRTQGSSRVDVPQCLNRVFVVTRHKLLFDNEGFVVNCLRWHAPWPGRSATALFELLL